MVSVLRGAQVIDGCEIETGAGCAEGVGATRIKHFSSPFRRERIYLEDITVDMEADDDFGSVVLCDFPASNVVVLGAVVSLVATGTGGVDTLANIDVAIGTVATASTDFSNAGEDNIVPKIDATSGGVITGVSSSSTINVYLAAGTEKLYLNMSDAISTDGTIVYNGYVDLVYVDLGVAS